MTYILTWIRDYSTNKFFKCLTNFQEDQQQKFFFFKLFMYSIYCKIGWSFRSSYFSKTRNTTGNRLIGWFSHHQKNVQVFYHFSLRLLAENNAVLVLYLYLIETKQREKYSFLIFPLAEIKRSPVNVTVICWCVLIRRKYLHPDLPKSLVSDRTISQNGVRKNNQLPQET